MASEMVEEAPAVIPAAYDDMTKPFFPKNTPSESAESGKELDEAAEVEALLSDPHRGVEELDLDPDTDIMPIEGKRKRRKLLFSSKLHGNAELYV